MGCDLYKKGAELLNPEIYICVTTRVVDIGEIVYDCYTDVSEIDCNEYAGAPGYSLEIYTSNQTCEEFCNTVYGYSCTTLDRF